MLQAQIPTPRRRAAPVYGGAAVPAKTLNGMLSPRLEATRGLESKTALSYLARPHDSGPSRASSPTAPDASSCAELNTSPGTLGIVSPSLTASASTTPLMTPTLHEVAQARHVSFSDNVSEYCPSDADESDSDSSAVRPVLSQKRLLLEKPLLNSFFDQFGGPPTAPVQAPHEELERMLVDAVRNTNMRRSKALKRLHEATDADDKAFWQTEHSHAEFIGATQWAFAHHKLAPNSGTKRPRLSRQDSFTTHKPHTAQQ
jgi:hypothetical protein